MVKILEATGKLDVVWDFRKLDIIGIDYPKDNKGNMGYEVLFFKRGFLTDKYPLKTKVKITIETI